MACAQKEGLIKLNVHYLINKQGSPIVQILRTTQKWPASNLVKRTIKDNKGNNHDEDESSFRQILQTNKKVDH